MFAMERGRNKRGELHYYSQGVLYEFELQQCRKLGDKSYITLIAIVLNFGSYLVTICISGQHVQILIWALFPSVFHFHACYFLCLFNDSFQGLTINIIRQQGLELLGINCCYSMSTLNQRGSSCKCPSYGDIIVNPKQKKKKTGWNYKDIFFLKNIPTMNIYVKMSQNRY